jgi:hypothetical protein
MLTARNTGVRQTGPSSFSWELDRSGWDDVVGLLEPFSRGSFDHGFQWLEPKTPGTVAFIISDRRHW